MEKPVAPADYEELIRVIHERYDSMSKGYQSIALYLTQNPNDVAVRSVNAIAERCGMHASNFVRFAQALGYYRLQGSSGAVPEAAVDGGAGLRGSGEGAGGRARGARRTESEYGFLRDLVVRDVASLQALLTDISPGRPGKGGRASREGRRRLSDRAAPLGAGRRPAALRSHHARQALRPARSERRARHAHGADDAARATSSWPCRSASTLPKSSTWSRGGRAQASSIIAISDSTLSPLAKSAEVLFAVPEHEYTFSRSLAAPMCLAQALTVALAARLQNNVEDPRIPIVTGR